MKLCWFLSESNMGLLGIGRKCILVIFQSRRWHTTITNGTKSSQPRMPQWLEVRHLLPLQLLQLLPCPLSSKRNSYVPLDLHDRHPQNHRVTHAWSRPREFVQAVVGCWLQLYMGNVVFSPIIKIMTPSLMNTSEKKQLINSFLSWHVIDLSGHTTSFSHPWLQTSSIFQSCHTSAMFSFTSFTQQNHHHSPRHRIRRAMFRNCQDVTDSELRQEVQTPPARRGYISSGSTIVHRTGTNGSTQMPQKTWKIMYLNRFLQVLKDVSSPERYEYLPYFTINSLPWRENARFDCHFQCCSLLGFMQFNICAVAD